MKAFQDYLVSKSFSPHTIKGYLSDVSLFLSFSKKEKGFCREDVVNYVQHLKTKNKSASTINRVLCALRHFVSDLVKDSDFIKIQQKYTSPVAVSKEEVLDFLRKLRRRQPFRDYCIALVMVNSGMRIAEVLGIRLSHLHNLNNNIVTVVGKGNKERNVVVNDVVVRAIKHYYNNERPRYKYATKSDYLFISNRSGKLNPATINRIFNDNSDTITPHQLRHVFATNALESGDIDLRQLQEQLGHSSLDTVMVYTHPSVEQVKKKMNGKSMKME